MRLVRSGKSSVSRYDGALCAMNFFIQSLTLFLEFDVLLKITLSQSRLGCLRLWDINRDSNTLYILKEFLVMCICWTQHIFVLTMVYCVNINVCRALRQPLLIIFLRSQHLKISRHFLLRNPKTSSSGWFWPCFGWSYLLVWRKCKFVNSFGCRWIVLNCSTSRFILTSSNLGHVCHRGSQNLRVVAVTAIFFNGRKNETVFVI